MAPVFDRLPIRTSEKSAHLASAARKFHTSWCSGGRSTATHNMSCFTTGCDETSAYISGAVCFRLLLTCGISLLWHCINHYMYEQSYNHKADNWDSAHLTLSSLNLSLTVAPWPRKYSMIRLIVTPTVPARISLIYCISTLKALRTDVHTWFFLEFAPLAISEVPFCVVRLLLHARAARTLFSMTSH